MTNRPEVFYAKIMLFGEYSVICDSMGLTIPYAHFKGELSFLNKYRYTQGSCFAHSTWSTSIKTSTRTSFLNQLSRRALASAAQELYVQQYISAMRRIRSAHSAT